MSNPSEPPTPVVIVPANPPLEPPTYANAVQMYVLPFSDVTLLFMRANVSSPETTKTARETGHLDAPVVSSVTLSFQCAQNLFSQLSQVFSAGVTTQ